MVHNKSCNKIEVSKYLKALDNSRESGDIYSLINKNKKTLKEHTRKFLICKNCILAENFIRVLKENFPKEGISNTQWKKIVTIADRERNSLIDLDIFFDLVGNYSRINVSVPKNVR
jgi:hypothetical protein